MPMMLSTKAKPMEMERLNVQDDVVHNRFAISHDDISDTPTHFVCNMDGGELVFDWLDDTFVPDLQRRRVAFDYWGPAFLLLDKCSLHFGEGVTKIWDEHNLKLLHIPPHSSHFLQCLDARVLGIAKRRIREVNHTEEVNIKTSHDIQFMNEFFSAAVPMNK
jgi:hypothetical protein